MVSPLTVQATFVASAAIVIEASLSFIGAGTPTDDPVMGNIMSDGKALWQIRPYLVFIPAGFLTLTVLGVNPSRRRIERCARSTFFGARVMALLEVKDLRIAFASSDGLLPAVHGTSFTVDAGEDRRHCRRNPVPENPLRRCRCFVCSRNRKPGSAERSCSRAGIF